MQQRYYSIIGIIAICAMILISGCGKQNLDYTTADTSNGADTIGNTIDIKDDSKEWVEISLFCQCCKEPWGDDADIKSFFEDIGINVYDVEIKSRGVVCEACSCESYDIKKILIDSIDKEDLLIILDEYNSTTQI